MIQTKLKTMCRCSMVLRRCRCSLKGMLFLCNTFELCFIYVCSHRARVSLWASLNFHSTPRDYNLRCSAPDSFSEERWEWGLLAQVRSLLGAVRWIYTSKQAGDVLYSLHTQLQRNVCLSFLLLSDSDWYRLSFTDGQLSRLPELIIKGNNSNTHHACLSDCKNCRNCPSACFKLNLQMMKLDLHYTVYQWSTSYADIQWTKWTQIWINNNRSSLFTKWSFTALQQINLIQYRSVVFSLPQWAVIGWKLHTQKYCYTDVLND